MTIQQIIRKAIKGGYKGDRDFIINLPEYAKHQIWNDPLFWQCLGKAIGWIDLMPSTYNFNDDIPEWKHQWHHFIDHLASGKSIESFFESL